MDHEPGLTQYCTSLIPVTIKSWGWLYSLSRKELSQPHFPLVTDKKAIANIAHSHVCPLLPPKHCKTSAQDTDTSRPWHRQSFGLADLPEADFYREVVKPEQFQSKPSQGLSCDTVFPWQAAAGMPQALSGLLPAWLSSCAHAGIPTAGPCQLLGSHCHTALCSCWAQTYSSSYF